MSFEEKDIELIKKQYLCCTPTKKLIFSESTEKGEKKINYEAQIKIFENTIEEPASSNYPSRLSYRISFLRFLIEKLENDGEEIYDKLYETLTHYMTVNDDKNSTHYRQFLIKDSDRIILQESKNLISEGTTGLRTWQAGFALAEWCNVNNWKINGKNILELGSGAGLSGLTVIRTCLPKRYIFTDCHSGVLDLLLKNVRLNLEENEKMIHDDRFPVEWKEECYKTIYGKTEVRIKRLSWSSMSESEIEASWSKPEVVLASDVIYDESIFDELIEALRIFIMRSKVLVIVATTVRNEETLMTFLEKLDTYGLSYEDENVPKPALFLKFDDDPVRILKIFRKE